MTDYPRVLLDGAAHLRLQALGTRRLNVGCGLFPLPYWTNLDGDRQAIADHYATVPPLPFPDGTFDEIYAGHFLEHLTEPEGKRFVAECWRCLVPGGRLGLVVPDTHEVLIRHLAGTVDCVEHAGVYHAVADLDAVCRVFFYSTVQASPHRWSYDLSTLERLLETSGFEVTGEIDRYRDPRLIRGVWYQCGADARKVAA